MNIALCAMFQNATEYLQRYAMQVKSLRDAAPQHEFDMILAEGDSTDGDATWRSLNDLFPGKAFKRVHGGQIYGPIDVTQRWLQISFVMDGVFERVRPEHEAVIWVESDLIWEPATLLKLLDHIQKPGVDAAVPMIWMRGAFYDIWGYRRDGIRFTNNPPYHRLFSIPPVNGLYLLDSGGGCVAMRGEIARSCRCRPPALAAVGFYQDMRVHGWRVWLDPTLSISHPPR
jgi:hypothetical protein